MDYIIVSGVRPYDGRYELDLSAELTTREWGWIKRLAGYLPIQMDDVSFSDPELVCVLTAIAIRRGGRIQAAEVPAVFERLADAPFGATITLESDGEPAEPGDAGPPSRNLNGSSPDSGPSSARSSASWEPPILEPTGTPDSATSESSPTPSAS